MGARAGVALACLALGTADLVYLNLEIAPAVLAGAEARADEIAAGASAGPSPRPLAPASPLASAPAAALRAGASAGADTTARPAAVAAPAEPIEVMVHFASGSHELTPEALAILDELAASLAGKDVSLSIEGHADRRGELAHNQGLSRRRAERVADHLASLGLPRERMRVRAFGELRPLDPGPGPAADRRNRRVAVRAEPAGQDAGDSP